MLITEKYFHVFHGYIHQMHLILRTKKHAWVWNVNVLNEVIEKIEENKRKLLFTITTRTIDNVILSI